MAKGLKYTGRAVSFRLPGSDKEYKHGDIVPISQRDALHMIDYSDLHSFELVDTGEDLLETKTAPQDDKKEGSK